MNSEIERRFITYVAPDFLYEFRQLNKHLKRLTALLESGLSVDDGESLIVALEAKPPDTLKESKTPVDAVSQIRVSGTHDGNDIQKCDV